MASRADGTVPEEENSLEESYEDEEVSTDSSELFEEPVSYESLQEAYNTVVEVYKGDPFFPESEVEAVDDGVLVPDADAYDSPGESLERLAEELEGDTLVVAFGFRGQDLPGYLEMQCSDMNAEGNWWDSPEELDADYLFDRTSYEGAVDITGFDSRPLMQSEGLERGLYLFRQD